MKRAAFAFAALVTMGGAALAAEGKDHAPICDDLTKIKAEYAKDPKLKETKFTPLTVGQYHFIEGVYAGSRFTPPGMPPGDGAQLLQLKDNYSIIWTHGKQACITVIAIPSEGGEVHLAYMPLPIAPSVAKLLNAVKTGIDETSTSDDTSGDLKL